MSSPTIVKDFGAALRFVKGCPNISVIRFKTHGRAAPKRRKGRSNEMTEADWDKFEKDIADAFEQVP